MNPSELSAYAHAATAKAAAARNRRDAANQSTMSPEGAAMDGELNTIRNKMKRLEGQTELSPKQFRSYASLMREQLSITEPGWREELEKFVKELRTKNVG
jgi:hypothetical protein